MSVSLSVTDDSPSGMIASATCCASSLETHLLYVNGYGYEQEEINARAEKAGGPDVDWLSWSIQARHSMWPVTTGDCG